MAQNIGNEKMTQIFSTGPAFRQARDRGDAAQAEAILFDMWNQVPDPKEDWDIAGMIMGQFVTFYTHIGSAPKALEWLARWELFNADAASASRHIFAGRTFFDLGLHDAAYPRFLAAFRESKTRPFQGLDPKYLAFLRTRMATEGTKG